MAGNDEYTKLLLHMDGDNDGTVFTDDSASGHAVTRYGSVTKTGIKQFGTAAGYFSGTNQYLRIGNHEDFNFGTGDFTTDLWVYPSDVTSPYRPLWTWWLDVNNYVVFSIYNGDGLEFNWKLGGDQMYSEYVGGCFTAASWQHVALVRSGNNMKMYVQGVIKRSFTITEDLGNMGRPFDVGGLWNGYEFKGYMDEFRVSKGIARWTADFSGNLPDEPYSTPYSLSGQLTEEARVLIIRESDWFIEDNTVRSAGSWNYNTTVGSKTVMAQLSDGETISYGKVDPKAP